MTARDPSHPTTFLPMTAGFAPLVGHHRHLLDDRVRTTAFLRAIARVVRPGDRVVDLGTGTGILAVAARAAGARHVWAIEHGPIVHVARAIAEANGVAEGITFVAQPARDATLREPIDVVVSECFGPWAIGGTMIRAVTELRARVNPDRIIPASVTLYAAPVEDRALHRHVAVFARPRYGIDWAVAHALAANNVYTTTIAPRALVAPGAPIHAIDFARDAWDGTLAATATFAARRAATVHGIAGWFVADLGGGITLSTAPGKPATIWRQIFLPLPAGIRVARGAPIALAIAAHGGEHVDWSGTIGERAFRGSTRYSDPRALR